MTEQDWLESDEPGRMLDYLRGKTSVRKLRLFACACCRLQPDYIAEVRVGRLCLRPYEGMDKETQLVFDTAEKYAESCFPIGKKNFRFNSYDYALPHLCDFRPSHPLEWAVEMIDLTLACSKQPCDKGFSVSRRQARILQEIIGNPFRPVPINPSWLTWNGATIPKLAQTVYDDRRFQDLPVLADALEEAGCTNADMLDHCRQPGEHVRGCWVVDLMLGKT
jgi:hypothetical protein